VSFLPWNWHYGYAMELENVLIVVDLEEFVDEIIEEYKSQKKC
jgi:hypothetical protein